MKIRKSLLAVLLIIVFLLFAVASGSDSSSETASQGSDAAVSVPEEDNTTLGDYSVEIDSCRLAQDFEGKPIVIVKYIFTNVSDDDAASFSFALDASVYQNGVGLNESYFADDSANYNSDNQMKDIKQGATLEVEVAYELNDTSTDIVVEVSEFISFSDKVITKTFSIAQ